MTQKVYSGPERHWRSVPRALYCDPRTGNVYTSGDNGFLVRYRPQADKLELTWMRLPGECWEGLSSFDYPVIEAFDAGPKGDLYAATNDGFVVRVDLGKERVAVLGKLRGVPLTVHGDGTQTRSFCYVSDLVDGLCRLLLADEPYPVNLGWK